MSPSNAERSDLKRKREDGAGKITSVPTKRARSGSGERAHVANGINGTSRSPERASSAAHVTKNTHQHRRSSRSPPQHRRHSGSASMSNAQRKQFRKDVENGLNGRSNDQSTQTASRNGGSQSGGKTKKRRNSNSATAGMSKNQLRKLKKQAKVPQDAEDVAGVQGSRPSDATPESKAARKLAKRQARESNKGKAKKYRPVVSQRDLAWSLSDPIGGRMIDSAAVFSPDESSILFATDHSVQSCSAAKSIVEQQFTSESSGDITAFALSLNDPATAYVGTRKGYIISWDYQRGRQQGRWMIGSPIWNIQCGMLPSMTQETVFTIDQSRGRWNITAHRFGIGGDLARTELTTLLKHDQPIHSACILGEAEGIAALTPHGLILGRLQSGEVQNLKQLSYAWLEIPSNDPPTCLDAQISKTVPGENNDLDFDIAFGGLTGTVFVYRKVLEKLGMSVKPSKFLSRGYASPPNVLHWHRQAVGAVAFSRDGEYIISGGRETVLVLWQLDTGRKQFLPHLESPIVSLAVSPSGALYAIGLADNSVMTLSTVEMKPVANFAGLQTSCTSTTPSHRLMMATQELLDHIIKNEAPAMIPAAIDPIDPDVLECTVPAHQSIRDEKFPRHDARPYIQTYSIEASGRMGHVARQAVTRTNATSTNTGPEGNYLHEPDVVHLATSQNGRWLATVDEWKPPRQQVEEMISNNAELNEELANQRVVSLKFWQRDSASESRGWELNTRIDAPHTFENKKQSCQILSLVACNNGSTFATVGEDGKLRLWTPKTQAPDSRVFWGESLPGPMSNASKKNIRIWWAAKHVIELDSPIATGSAMDVRPSHACMGSSNDGSLLAVHIHYQAPSKELVPLEIGIIDDQSGVNDADGSLIHFVDVDFGKVRELRSDLCPLTEALASTSSRPPQRYDGIHKLAFMDQCLIVVSKQAAFVWDITSFTLLRTIMLPPAKPTDSGAGPIHSAIPAPLLAVNLASHTFAISSAVPMPQIEREANASMALPPHAHRDYTSRVAVFKAPGTSTLDLPQELYASTTPRLVLALLDAAGGGAPDAAAMSAAGAQAPLRRPLRKGYQTIDCAATIRTIRAPLVADAARLARLEADEAEAAASAAEDGAPPTAAAGALVRAHAAQVEGRRQTTNIDDADRDEASADEEYGENTRPAVGAMQQPPAAGRRGFSTVVTPEQLAAVLEPDPTTLAMPPLKTMFDGVMALFAGRRDAPTPSK